MNPGNQASSSWPVVLIPAGSEAILGDKVVLLASFPKEVFLCFKHTPIYKEAVIDE